MASIQASINTIFHKRWQDLVDACVLVIFVAFSAWLMWSTFFISGTDIIMASKLYSDFGVHLPLIRSFSFGANYPPEYPFFAGEPIRYHYLFYMAVGIIESWGVPLDIALNVLSSFGMALLLWMVYKLGILFFRSRWVGLLAVFLLLFNGSLSFLNFFSQHQWDDTLFTQIVTATSFASFGPWDGQMVSAFWNWNVYTNQRHLALSYGLALAMLYPLFAHTKYGDEHLPWWKQLGLFILAGMFAFLHQAGTLAFVGICTGWLVWYARVIDKKWLITYGVVIGIVCMATAWFMWHRGAGNIAVHIGFLAPDSSIQTILRYWWYNLGVYLVLLPVLLWWSKRQAGIFLVLCFGLFAVANVFRLSTDMINNHKFIHFFMIGMQIITAGWLVHLWQHYAWKRALVIILAMTLTFSGMLDIFPIINDRYITIPNHTGSDAQQWIISNTHPRSQFLTTTFLYNPASLAGRTLYLDYGYHAWSMGYVDTHKRANLPHLFGFASVLENDTWCSMMTEADIAYVILSPHGRDLPDEIDLEASYVITELVPSYVSTDGFTIYSVSESCWDYKGAATSV